MTNIIIREKKILKIIILTRRSKNLKMCIKNQMNYISKQREYKLKLKYMKFN